MAAESRKTLDIGLRKICQELLPPFISTEMEPLEAYLLGLVERQEMPPKTSRGINWRKIATECQAHYGEITYVKEILRPGLSAITIYAESLADAPERKSNAENNEFERTISHPDDFSDECADKDHAPDSLSLAQALRNVMDEHGDSPERLTRKLLSQGFRTDYRSIRLWTKGRSPKTKSSFIALQRIAEHYHLPSNYFIERNKTRSRLSFIGIEQFCPLVRSVVAYHLPDDFNDRAPSDQEEIFEWIRNHVLSGRTEYRKFLGEAVSEKYRISFSLVPVTALECQIASLIDSKTVGRSEKSALEGETPWSEGTVELIKNRLGTIFGAITAPADFKPAGLQVPRENLCLGLLAFPAVVDWYLRWAEDRRGFYTVSELHAVNIIRGLIAHNTGWIRQNPQCAQQATAIPGLISEDELTAARQDWNAACDKPQEHLSNRARAISKNKIIHRDSFEAIAPALAAENPYVEYYKIADEILLQSPDPAVDPVGAAESSRSYLMVRFGLHLALRQKNLRQLLLCLPDEKPRSARELRKLKCGEVRWDKRVQKWQVFIPHTAFKNSTSSFFGKQPWIYYLEDIDGLYGHIDSYIVHHRNTLLCDHADPGNFFVRTISRKCREAVYQRGEFYQAWYEITQLYGIYNSYTGRGAIEHLVPHGPHNVRDVVATQILRETHDARRAGYAIQDTPQAVERYYGRLLPKEKAAEAAKILNNTWTRIRNSARGPNFGISH